MHCVVFFAGHSVPEWVLPANITEVLSQKDIRIKAFYVSAVDLQHYGRVEMLAPAGTSSEFADYVQQQNVKEAHSAFVPLQVLLRPYNIEVSPSVIFGKKGLRACLRSLLQKEPDLLVYPDELLATI